MRGEHDPHNDWGTTWPPGRIEAEVRADRDTALDRLAAVIALVHAAESKDGLIPACQARTALGMGPRTRTKETP